MNGDIHIRAFFFGLGEHTVTRRPRQPDRPGNRLSRRFVVTRHEIPYSTRFSSRSLTARSPCNASYDRSGISLPATWRSRGGELDDLAPARPHPKTPRKRRLKGLSWIKSLAPQLCRPIPLSCCPRASRIPGSSRMIPDYPGLKLGSCLSERVLALYRRMEAAWPSRNYVTESALGTPGRSSSPISSLDPRSFERWGLTLLGLLTALAWCT